MNDATARRGAGLIAGPVGTGLHNDKSDVETVQRLLNNAFEKGRFALSEPLSADGLFGGKTRAAIEACQREALGIAAPSGFVEPDDATFDALCRDLPEDYSPLLLSLVMLAARQSQIDRFGEPIGRCFATFDISTPLRQAHFLAQIGHESGELRYQEEIASGAAYEGRDDLGNTEPGDGVRFKGRGLIQLTGRFNYTRFADALGRRDELLATPRLVAEDLDLCVGAAGWFWAENGINALADADDVEAVTRRINGGLNGIDDRRRLLVRAKSLYAL